MEKSSKSESPSRADASLPRDFGALVRGRDNNFDLIRIVAATGVLLGHAYDLSPKPGQTDPFRRLFGWTYSGHLAVLAFFLISGILIPQSYERSSPRRFAAMRFARIWPGLAVCVILSVAVAGLFFTTLPLAAYLSSRLTWKYLLENLSLLNTAYYLPGVFEGNHYPRAINGSLWTLPVEVSMYAIVFALGLFGWLKSEKKLCAAAALFAAATFVPARYPLHFNASESMRSPALFFVAGTLAYRFRDRLRLDARVLAALLAGFLLVWRTPAGLYAFYPFFAYLVLCLAGWRPLRRLRPKSDISYGVYIYGFVVQQIVAALLPDVSPLKSLLLSVPVTLALGGLSWNIVEKPALEFARGRFSSGSRRGN